MESRQTAKEIFESFLKVRKQVSDFIELCNIQSRLVESLGLSETKVSNSEMNKIICCNQEVVVDSLIEYAEYVTETTESEPDFMFAVIKFEPNTTLYVLYNVSDPSDPMMLVRKTPNNKSLVHSRGSAQFHATKELMKRVTEVVEQF